jgi:phytoene synthase
VCDDRIDDRGLDESVRASAWRSLFTQTRDAQGAVFSEFAQVRSRYRIPASYWEELLAGMRMDLEVARYRTLKELELYCFRVAGTVGLMMCHLFRLNDDQALSAAADLGIGMQLTNIARDVLDDARMGRVYLPAAWMDEEGVPSSPEAVLDPVNRAALARVVARLVSEAERYYGSGLRGTRHLPPRAAWTVAAAASIYRAIGRKVAARGAHAWDQRVYVRKPEMLLRLCIAALPSWVRWIRGGAAARFDLPRQVWRYEA